MDDLQLNITASSKVSYCFFFFIKTIYWMILCGNYFFRNKINQTKKNILKRRQMNTNSSQNQILVVRLLQERGLKMSTKRIFHKRIQSIQNHEIKYLNYPMVVLPNKKIYKQDCEIWAKIKVNSMVKTTKMSLTIYR